MHKKEKQIEISEEIHVDEAAGDARELAKTAGFTPVGQSMVSTAVSELARNIYRYAINGQITIKLLDNMNSKGIEVIAEDNGPGITDLESAMKNGFSTTDNSLGVGLPGVKRMMDEFLIDTGSSIGTRITIRKWVQKSR